MITKFDNFLYEFKNNKTPLLDEIIDKMSEYGMESLSEIEKEYLNNYSNDNKREEIEDNIYGNNEVDDNNPEDSEEDKDYSSIWNNLRDEDFEDFVYSYNLPHDITTQSWDRLHISIRDKFKKFIDETGIDF